MGYQVRGLNLDRLLNPDATLRNFCTFACEFHHGEINTEELEDSPALNTWYRKMAISNLSL